MLGHNFVIYVYNKISLEFTALFYTPTLNIKVECLSETLVNTSQNPRWHIPQHHNPNINKYKIFKSINPFLGQTAPTGPGSPHSRRTTVGRTPLDE